jgi:NAD(P)-dependent dehydrogenase (short-subunit alcohol dehydrogenase family)
MSERREAGRIDVLCNNAAYITDKRHNAGEATDEEWEKSFRVSLGNTTFH